MGLRYKHRQAFSFHNFAQFLFRCLKMFVFFLDASTFVARIHSSFNMSSASFKILTVSSFCFSSLLVSVVPSGTLKVGADATLECKTNPGVSGQPNPNVKWQKPDGSVETKPKVELKHVASSDKGTWSCLVSHQGETFTKSVTINVEGRMFSLKYKTTLKKLLCSEV